VNKKPIRIYGGNSLLKSSTMGFGVRGYGESGGASRFFYCAKASKSERNTGLKGINPKQRDLTRKKGKPGGDNPRNRGVKEMQNSHPTVKPLNLMEYLCILTKTPLGGVVLDPFMGTGTTGMACKLTGRHFIGIELEKEYCKLAKLRMKATKRIKPNKSISNVWK
ncbi:hypothetical protein LCGC14_1466800, partial [marine sediment metagenome]